MSISWIRYSCTRAEGVHMKDWGKDHWSTMLYLESRAVDNKGIIENAQMRCHRSLHPEFAHIDGTCPTRLRGGRVLSHHDDWSCLEDIVFAGLVYAEVEDIERRPKRVRVSFTPLGWLIAQELRKHRAAPRRSDFDFSYYLLGIGKGSLYEKNG